MELYGSIVGNSVSLKWNHVNDASNYSVSVEKCQNNLCTQIFHIWTSDNSLEKTSDIFESCTSYNAKIWALSIQDKLVFKETTLIHKDPSQCDTSDPLQATLIATLVVIGLLILLCVALLIFYHKRKPIQGIQRVRSRVYSRLYAKEQYFRPVPKGDFLEKVSELLDSENASDLRLEFEELEHISFDTIHRKTSASNLAVNRKRIRYNDIVPYDANRVTLHPSVALEGDKAKSDFINASFISGSQCRYIAAQGPSDDTCQLFWEMIWQQNVRMVVMLTKLIEGYGYNALKCSQYWPDTIGSSRHYADIDVQLYDLQEAPDYTVRKFDVSRRSSNESREIIQIQFTSWPDRSAPDDPKLLLQLIDVCRAFNQQYNRESQSPWLVHCSAGIGRTGTFIAVDQLLRQCEDRSVDKLDVFNFVYNLRKERRHMVQTDSQYIYLYSCVWQHMHDRQF